MKLRRGCGCPILILLLFDLLLLVGALIGLIRGPSEEPFQATRLGSGLSAILMLGNLAVCVLLLLTALRGDSGAGSTTDPDAEGYDGEAESNDGGEEEG